MKFTLSTLVNTLKSFRVNRAGHTGMVFAMTIVPVVSFVGSSIDYGMALRAKERLQHVTDAAAQAGARLPATAKQNRETAALKSFQQNAGDVFTGITPTVQASNSTVTVTASYSSPTAFMGLIGVMSIDVSTTSAARSQVQNGGVACLLALNPNTEDGLHLQGITKFSEQNCWAWVNSSHSTAINAVGASTGTAQGFCSTGGVLGAEHFTPSPYTGCDPIPDPFTNLRLPASSGCDYNNMQVNNGVATLNPGIYCGGLDLKPQADVTFNPGVYVIKNGKFNVQAQSVARGDGVVFYFVGEGTGFEVKGGGSIDFKAPATGDLAGFLFVQNKYANPGQETKIQGGARIKMVGILYMPTWRVNIGGNGDVNQETEAWAMVADSFYLEGNGKLYLRPNFGQVGLPENLLPKIANGPLMLQ